MRVVVSYDIVTETPSGKKRLRKIAKLCENYGVRVQFSVFECQITPADWIVLKSKLGSLIDPEQDSIRYYLLGKNWERKIGHLGVKKHFDMQKDHLIL